ncbi:hypothetical protein SeMB42_g06923 [Synchytrium endobioticum]|uniref:TMC domain-containing protein n=1 Tax=Synchytrium endobioticum TaxID=286115 RepID=A0A507CDC9_9FUNG|nr:hypothetical protein SeMB42_g06923 [Synchytrium endobioticum]TPX43926.1 hypothetical protein SeLEV6574_g04804 [Synchytrium endobioticum]
MLPVPSLNAMANDHDHALPSKSATTTTPAAVTIQNSANPLAPMSATTASHDELVDEFKPLLIPSQDPAVVVPTAAARSSALDTRTRSSAVLGPNGRPIVLSHSSNRIHEAALKAIQDKVRPDATGDAADKLMAQALIDMEEEAVRVGRSRRASVSANDSVLVGPRERRKSVLRRRSSFNATSATPQSSSGANTIQSKQTSAYPRAMPSLAETNDISPKPKTRLPSPTTDCRHVHQPPALEVPRAADAAVTRIDMLNTASAQRTTTSNSLSPSSADPANPVDPRKLMTPVSPHGDPIPASQAMPSHVNFYRAANRGTIPHAIPGDDGGKYIGFDGIGRRDLRHLTKDSRTVSFKKSVAKKRAKERAASQDALNKTNGEPQGQVAVEVEKTTIVDENTPRERTKTPFQTNSKRAQLKGLGRWIYDMKKWMRRHPMKKFFTVPIWISAIKAIENRFGTSIASYFVIARWAFLLNLVLASIWFWFIFVEGFLGMSDSTPVGSTKLVNMSGGGGFLNFFTGSAGWAYTVMFYGGYTSQAFGASYRLDLAWIFCIFAFFGVSFLAIVLTMRALFVSRPYGSSTVSSDGYTPFSAVLFSAWDFGRTSSKAVKTHNIGISTILKALITQDSIKRKLKERTLKEQRTLIAKRVFSNIATLLVLALACYLIYLASIVDAGSSRYVSLVMSAMNLAFPLVFAFLGKFEKWHSPELEMTMMLARTYVLKMASIYVVLYGIYIQLYSPKAPLCWENLVGQAFWQLVWLDVAITTATTIGEAVFYNRIWNRWEFDLPSSTLAIVYRQALIWVGSIYSPATALLGVLTSFILFYVKHYTLIYFGEPPKIIHNSTKQVFWFLAFMACTLVLSGFPIWWAILRIPSSCGPHDPSTWPLTSAQGALRVMYDVIPKWANAMSGPAATFFSTISNIAFLGPILTFLCLCVLYLITLSQKRLQKLNELEEELFEEREDKRFLMRFYKIQT